LRVLTPASNIEQPGDVGDRAHTNIEIVSPMGGGQVTPQVTPPTPGQATPFIPPFKGLLFGTPASVGCVYKLTTTSTPASKCDPNVVPANPTGGSRAIGIVDAFDDPTALKDLTAFSKQFGLPAPNLTVVKLGNPGIDQGWALEESLDI